MAEERAKLGAATRLIHPDAHASRDFNSLAVPIYRASTVLFDGLADAHDKASLKGDYTYGLHGTPTSRELALRIAELEQADYCLLVPSGLAAIALVDLALCRAGSHLLIPHSAYGPNVRLAREFMSRFGVETEFYDPLIGSGIGSMIRENTALIWTESPGSVTMELQDVPAIAAAARSRGVPVALDNTYSGGVLNNAFELGANISVQALTKYQAGHSDCLMGSVATRDEALADKLEATHQTFGQGVSPDDCALVLRGLSTMRLRMSAIESSALKVAQWLKSRPEVERVLHPAFPDCPGHEIWKRDFKGSAGVFSVIFRDWDWSRLERFVDALTIFQVGYSWGGVASLAMAYPALTRPSPEAGQRLVRLNIGLEDPEDLIADLAVAIETASAA